MLDSETKTENSWNHLDVSWIKQNYAEAESFFASGDEIPSDDLMRLLGSNGYSPNPFFDEDYYVRRYPDVRTLIENGTYVSGFDHYRSVGFRSRSPHWLFNEEYYIIMNADVARELLSGAAFCNGYDHYIRVGDSEFRSGSWFFDPLEYIKSTVGGASRAPFRHYLNSQSRYSNSFWFDTEWFMKTYPDVLEEVNQGKWKSILHYYLFRKSEGAHDPSEYFLERFYTDTNSDIGDAIRSGRFNSGYEHFLLYGIKERRRPHPAVDLEQYYHNPYTQKLLLSGRVSDVFSAWCLTKGVAPDTRVILEEREEVTKYAYEKKATAISINAARKPIDFTCRDYNISVILVVYNNLDMTLNALASLRASYTGDIDLIIVDSGSRDETRHIGRYVQGAVVLQSESNIGFLRACNMAVQHARAPFILFLNNDTEIQPGSISSAIERFRRDQRVGVIGAKLIRTNGLMQEAGSTIFRDGSVTGYMRNASPDIPEVNFVRRVDFCSGACLFTRTDLVRLLGGFDESYIPAYYEETDYCVRVWKLGFEVIYDPSVVTIHYEFGSSSKESGSSYINRNRFIFNARHTDFLSQKFVGSRLNTHAARSPRRTGSKRILFIEDAIPLKHFGSGFSRSHDIITTMSNLGHEVTVFPIYKPAVSTSRLYASFPDNVEIIWDRELGDLKSFLVDRIGCYDVIWIARTHNVRRLVPILGETAHLMPQISIVADTEAVSSIREEQKDRLAGIPVEKLPSLADRLRAECECLRIATKAVVVSSEDAEVLASQGFASVPVLGHLQTPQPGSKPWEDRSGFLFVGAIHESDSPNYDAVAWLATALWPVLEMALPPETTLTIAGYLGPKASLSGLPRTSRIVYLGEVDDLAPLYDSARFFIAPTRYAAGIPYKLHEAAAHGLPIIASDILRRQIGWKNGDEILEATAGDAESFYDTIVRAYDDRTLWESLRSNALERISNDHNAKIYGERITDILK